MKFAKVNGERQEPSKGLLGLCQGCDNQVIPVCGPKRVWHWRHKVDCECDRWWENETEWHRAWKNMFPKACQEIRLKDEHTGEWHIADVKTEQGLIIEFQHSFLKNEERISRNKFYGENLIWVIDGLKRKRDKSQFEVFLKYARPISENFGVLKLHPFLDECSILNDWSECNNLVFFDFGKTDSIWCLMPSHSRKHRYVFPYIRQNLVSILNGSLNGNDFLDLLNYLNKITYIFENPNQLIVQKNSQVPTVSAPAHHRPARVSVNYNLNDLYRLIKLPTYSRRKFRF